VKNFGGVPLVTSVMMPDEAVGIKRATQAETYAMIEKDLREAIPDLPLRSAYAATDMGRVTKGAAQGILAKVYLYQDKYASS
jgi:tartrate dehydratase alpha subunit/fumarate hydratase class I-like protein